jgi:hypothetical protein
LSKLTNGKKEKCISIIKLLGFLIKSYENVSGTKRTGVTLSAEFPNNPADSADVLQKN